MAMHEPELPSQVLLMPAPLELGSDITTPLGLEILAYLRTGTTTTRLPIRQYYGPDLRVVHIRYGHIDVT